MWISVFRDMYAKLGVISFFSACYDNFLMNAQWKQIRGSKVILFMPLGPLHWDVN